MAIDVKTICLGVLSLGDASGYEIRKHFEEGPFSHFFDASYGSIYPALNTLHTNGLVDCLAVAQDKRPAKKVYSLTESGRAALLDVLVQPPAADKIRSECLVILFFSQLIGATRQRVIFDNYLLHLREADARVANTDVTDAPKGRQFVHGFGHAIYRAAIEYMESQEEILFGPEEDQAEHRLAGAAE